MDQYPRFQRGGFRQRPSYQPRHYAPDRAGNGVYNPRPNRPYFDRGRARGGNSAPRRFNGNPRYQNSSSRGRGQQSSYNQQYGYEEEEKQVQYGYEEETEKGQFDMVDSTYVKTETYSTGTAKPTTSEDVDYEIVEDEGSAEDGMQSKSEFEVEIEDSYEAEAAAYIDQLGDEFGQGEGDEGYENNTPDGKDHANNGYTDKASSDDKNLSNESTVKTVENVTAEEKSELSTDTDVKREEPNKEEEEDGDSDSSEEDTGFCKYCKLSFTSAKAFHTHTRGIQHTALVMEAKAKKGNVHYQKEEVDAEVLKVVIPEPVVVTEEQVDEEIDLDNLNWMEMDMNEDTRNYIREKRKMKPEDKDLNPDDIGKSQFTDKYTCPLCDCKCTGALSFKMHIQGKQHKNNLEQAQRGGPLKKKKPQTAGVVVDMSERKAKLTEQLKSVEFAIIGLEFVTEFQKPDVNAAVRYVCNLCESKCDSSTIVSHLVGIKHRLKYLQEKDPHVYEHLTKYSSKRNKSEMNSSADDFAREIEKKVGQVEVKVKLELGEIDDDLEETMTRTSQALKETVADLEKRSHEKRDFPPEKKARYEDDDDYNRRPYPPHRDYPPRGYPPRGYPPRGYPPRGPPSRDYPPRGYPPRDYPPWDYPSRDYPPRDYPPRDYPPRDYPRSFAEEHYEYNRRNPYDAEYRDRFAYRYKDPYYDRMFDDERRRLDTMMERRYRLTDPVLERQRVDDIIARREYLERQEQARLDDILERRRRLQTPQTDDVDFERLKRFENRALPSESHRSSRDSRSRTDPAPTADRSESATSTSSRPRYEERPDMEELLARRRGLNYGDRPRVDADPPPQPQASKGQEQERVVKALQAEVVKNPNINVTEVMAKLRSSSTITSEVDAAMALEISNALTNALLQYRLQNAPQEIRSMAETSIQPSIPGLDSGISTASNSHVPSFLRNTTAHLATASHYNTHATQSAAPSQYNTQSSAVSQYSTHANETDYSYPSVNQQSNSHYQQTGQFSGQLYNQQSQAQPAVPQTVLQLKSPVSQLTYSQAAKLPALAQSIVASNAAQSSRNAMPGQETQPITAPAKLLESIRKQTELLKQRLASATGNSGGAN